MPDYKKTIIYRIICKDINITDGYIGHTTNFKNRYNSHCMDTIIETRKHYNYRVYQIIRQNGGWNNWEMLEIEKHPCENNEEARKRERYFYDIYNSELNMIKPFTDIEERMQQQRTNAVAYYYKTDYYESNKEQIKNRVKEYADTHKVEICEKGKKYRQKNKEVIQAKKSMPILCCCGINTDSAHQSRHNRTVRHIKIVEQNI
jgi:hypothetical protein